jgi:hypothetical protein
MSYFPRRGWNWTPLWVCPLTVTSAVHRRSDIYVNDLFSFVAVGIVDVVDKLTQYYII